MKADDASHLIARSLAAAQGGIQMEDRTFSVPVNNYLDEGLLKQERRAMLGFPLPVASSSEIAQPGDWIAKEIMGVPLLLTRDASGQLAAFLNVCRHRGARVAPEGSGSGRLAFSCPYHGWTYAADGSLQGIPQQFGFPCLDKAAHGLARLQAFERAGLVWCAPDPAATQVQEHQFSPLCDELESFGLAQHVPFAARKIVVSANWKLIVDGSFEAYHFKVAHRNTIAPLFANNVQIVDEHGLNRRLYLVKSHLSGDAVQARGPDVRHFGNIIYSFFPSTVLLLQPDHAQLSWLEPIDAATTLVHDVALLPQPPASDKALAHWEKNVALYRATLAEDYALAESIQAGLSSGANKHLTFGAFEFSGPRFHHQLAGVLRGTESNAPVKPSTSASS